jgi:hypothetical protein
MHHVHVKAGDNVYFELKGMSDTPKSVCLEYAGQTSEILVPATDATRAHLYSAKNKEENDMNPMETVNLFANPGMGGAATGAGLGAGLLGGVLGGALLGNNRGGILGGGNGGDGYSAINAINMNTDAKIASSTALSEARFNAEAQREIQAAVERSAAATQLAVAVGNAALGVEIAKGDGEISTQVALTTGNLGTQNALNAAAIQTLVQKTAGDLGVQIALGDARTQFEVQQAATAAALGFKDAALQSANQTFQLSNAVKADGDLTRSLIITQYQDTLNRQLATAQNEIIELRGDRNGRERARETEINVTQSVNQNQNNLQAQAQQQQQFQILANLAAQVSNLAGDIQAVRQTQSNVNFGNQIGSGQTASATNTRVN